MSIVVRLAENDREVREVQQLRNVAFRTDRDNPFGGYDRDKFDGYCDHLRLEKDGALIGTMRLRQSRYMPDMPFYSSSEFVTEGTHLAGIESLLEPGRFCTMQKLMDIRLPIALLIAEARYANARGIKTLMGCTSIDSVDPEEINRFFAYARARNAVEIGQPLIKARDNFFLEGFNPDFSVPKTGEYKAKSLADLYMKLGAKVISHPALDRELNCVDFLTTAYLKEAESRFRKYEEKFAKGIFFSRELDEDRLEPFWKNGRP